MTEKSTGLKTGHYNCWSYGTYDEYDIRCPLQGAGLKPGTTQTGTATQSQAAVRQTNYDMYLPMMAERRFFVPADTSLGSVMSAWARALAHLQSWATGKDFTASRRTCWAFSAF